MTQTIDSIQLVIAAKVRLRASDAQVADKVKQHQSEKGGNLCNTKKRRLRDLRAKLRDHVELEAAKSKDIVKGLSDADGPFTCCHQEQVLTRSTKMRNMLPPSLR